jgi:Asp-tRNA(Asn)/Glu-tRNA(Gln) amidotransferase A subunit family amidase
MFEDEAIMKFDDAVAMFHKGTMTPREYLERVIAVVEEKEPRIKAFACLDIAQARIQADASTDRYQRHAPLSAIDGMPVGIKDIIDTVSLPTCMGSDIYSGWQPRADAEAVDALKSAGAVIMGKTRTTEFAIGRATTTTNPHDPERTPGGSSSGTAAGVAAGMFCAGLGTQTQGSIVRPASYCGVFGYKPTWGLLSLHGVHPVSHSHDHLGVIAQSLDIAWSIAHCIMTYAPTSKSATLNASSLLASELAVSPRIAVLRTAGYSELNDDELHAFEQCLVRLKGHGVEISDIGDDPELAAFCTELDGVPAVSAEMVASDMRWPYLQYCKEHPAETGEKIHGMVKRGLAVSMERYAAMNESRDRLVTRFETLSKRYDTFVLPSSSGVAPLGLDNTGSRTLSVYGSYLGVPAVSLPMLTVGHMPLGIQLLGQRFDDYGLMCRAKWLAGRA